MSLVYIAGNLPDAEAAERCLTDNGIDYTLSLEPFTTTSVMGGVYVGLFVSVPTAQHQQCREILEANGLADTISMDQQGPPEERYGA